MCVFNFNHVLCSKVVHSIYSIYYITIKKQKTKSCLFIFVQVLEYTLYITCINNKHATITLLILLHRRITPFQLAVKSLGKCKQVLECGFLLPSDVVPYPRSTATSYTTDNNLKTRSQYNAPQLVTVPAWGEFGLVDLGLSVT